MLCLIDANAALYLWVFVALLSGAYSDKPLLFHSVLQMVKVGIVEQTAATSGTPLFGHFVVVEY